MELLRIISMAMVVAIHLNGAWTYVDGYGNFDFTSLRGFGIMLYQAFMIVAVNCFILISGFFGIKASKRGLLNILSYIIFYALICYTTGVFIGSVEFSFGSLIECLYKFDSHLWFVKTYLLLYILSFFINKGVETLNTKQLSFATIGLLFLDIYYGWVNNGDFGFNHLSINHMTTIYFIGRLLARLNNRISQISTATKSALLGSYILCCIATALMTAKYAYEFPMSYNSPFILGASVSLFMFFMTLNFQNKAVNFIAGSAFGVYLLHHSSHIWGNILHRSCSMMNYFGEWGYNFIYIPLIIIILFCSALFIDYFRKRITLPIVNFVLIGINNIENSICNILKIDK